MISLDLSKIQAISDKLIRLNSEAIGRVAVRSLNAVINRGFDGSRKQMLKGVNLTELYVKDHMQVDVANDPFKPVAKIIAFVPGGQGRPSVKSVNLRQYNPKLTLTPTNWRNTGEARNSDLKVFKPAVNSTLSADKHGPKTAKGALMYPNPRKPGSKLPFKPRIGNSVLNIPKGQKLKSISVEVVAGRRKMVKPRKGLAAFMQRMPNGETLVMRRKAGTKGKGKIEALYSMSVAQLFRFAKTAIVPVIMTDLESTVTEEVLEEFQRVVNL